MAIFGGIFPVDKRQIPLDIIAGITLAALAIPEVMGYARIAGMPVITGLYTILIPMAVFAVFCSSRHLVVGADSATAAILAASLVMLAVPASPHYVALAGGIALLAGIFLLLSRIFHFGFIADFLSRTVLIGFLTGVGFQIALSQLPGIFGVPAEGNFIFLQIINIPAEINQMNPLTVGMSCIVLVMILAGHKFFKQIPWALIAVAGTIIASWIWDFAGLGVAVLGPIPNGLPNLSIPSIPFFQLSDLLWPAMACFIVILAQSAATSRAYAFRYGEEFNENSDLVGLGFANLAASVSGTFVVNGSPTKTEMVDSAGGRTQIAHLVTVFLVLMVLFFLTKPLEFLPVAVLASNVFIIGLRLIDLSGMKGIFIRRPVEFGVALSTTVSVVVFGVAWGIVFAIILSVIAHLRHSYHPLDLLHYRTSDGKWISAPIESGKQAADGLVIYRFGANLYYANERRMSEEVMRIVHTARKPVKWFCFSASSVNDIDYSGSESLKQIYHQLHSLGITLILSHLEDHVFAELERDTLIELIGKDHVFSSKDEVLDAYNRLANV